MNKKIVIQVAMIEEISALLKKFDFIKLENIDSKLNFEHYNFQFNNLDIHVITQGKDINNVPQIGLESAALCTYLICTKIVPDLLINVGTCGGFMSKGCAIGKTYIVKSPVSFHDRRVSIPIFTQSQIGKYNTSNYSQLNDHLKLDENSVSSGSSFDISEEDLKQIQTQNAGLKEMELASIAWISNLYNIPLISLKGVTDLIEMPEHAVEQFQSNLELTSRNLNNNLERMINYLSSNVNDPIFEKLC